MVENKEKNFISAVIYVHNNESEIEKFLRSLIEILNSKFNKFEIICVDDHSDDSSVDVIKKYSGTLVNGTISIIKMSFYQGLEISMNAGVDLAIGDFVYEFDSIVMDYEEKIVTDVYDKALKGYDIVNASPITSPRYSSQVFYKLYNRYANSDYQLQTESFRILSRRAINRVHSMNITIPYRKAIYANSGLKLNKIEYNVMSKNQFRDSSKSKEVYKIRKDIAVDSLILFTNIAHKIAIGMTILMIFVTIFMALYSLYVFFGKNTPVEGWTTIILFLSVGFFGLFAISAIVIKYLSIIINLVFKKQKYTIESIEKVTR